METKLIAMILGVALMLAATVTVYTQSAFAFAQGGSGGDGGNAAGAGVIGGQTTHGLIPTACANPTVDQNNQNCHLPS
jgi:hypothetical protein